MTLDESVAVLKVHRDEIARCTTFEALKLQQLAFIDFLIEDYTEEINQRNEAIKVVLTTTQEGVVTNASEIPGS
jgi:hypothetical protein